MATRKELLESLVDASNRRIAAVKAKKRDQKLHNEDIKDIDVEIDEIMQQLEDKPAAATSDNEDEC